jgi:hypothetical protein
MNAQAWRSVSVMAAALVQGHPAAGIRRLAAGASEAGGILPSLLRRRIAAVQAVAVAGGACGPTVEPGVLALLAGDCRDAERLRFDYVTHGGGSAWRLVEPHGDVLRRRRLPTRSW